MPWDCFCPKCGDGIAGGMEDGEETDSAMKTFEEEYADPNKTIRCYCGCLFNPITFEIKGDDMYLDDGKFTLEMKLKGKHQGKTVTLLSCDIDCEKLEMLSDSSGTILKGAYDSLKNNLGERLRELEAKMAGTKNAEELRP